MEGRSDTNVCLCLCLSVFFCFPKFLSEFSFFFRVVCVFCGLGGNSVLDCVVSGCVAGAACAKCMLGDRGKRRMT